MHVDFMRRVDRWCGVPICFLLTLWRRLRGDVPDTSRPRRVLFIQTAEMGSLVLALPAVRHVQQAYAGCEVYALVFAPLAEAVEVIGLVPRDRVWTIDPSSLLTIARDTWKFARDSRRHGIDTVVNLEMFARFGSILTFLSGAKRRAGFHAFGESGLYCGDLLTHRVLYNPHVHTAEALLTIVQSLDEPPGHVPMGKLPRLAAVPSVGRIATTEDARRQTRARLDGQHPAIAGRRLIVVNPNASQLIPIRRWPIDSYAELVARLVADPANACVLTGTASEQPDTQFIVNKVRNERVVDLAGKTSIRELIDLYNVASVLVTNDSGPAQLAALTDVHILVFFGPETPALYGPLAEPERCTVLYSRYACSPCVSAYNQRKTDCNDNLCLKTIDVASVHATAASILERRA